MRSSTPLLRTFGLAVASAALLGAFHGAPATAKSAPAAAEASPDETSPAVEGGQETGQGPASSEPAAEDATAEEAAGSTPDAEPDAESDEPPAQDEPPWMAGREWIMDEEVGRRYTIEKLPKIEKTYRWQDENHIRLPGGLFNVEVVKHDDDWFWVKIYEPDLISRRAPRTPPPEGPTEAELEAAARTYVSEAGTADRIRLEPFDEGLPRAGQWRNGFDVADVNGDGHLDIVFGPSRKGRTHPNIFLGDGAGRWRRWSEARYPDLPYDYGDAAVADFNGDGHADLAFGVHLRGMLAIVGDGRGGFEPWTEGIAFDHPGQGGAATSFSSRAIEVVDWNRDGRPDLLALGEGPKGFSPRRAPGEDSPPIQGSRGLLLYVNQGDGTWSPQQVEDTPRDFGDDFALADFDGDGRSDVAVASRILGNRAILRLSAAGKDGLLTPQAIEQLRPKGRATAVVAGDLDGDGDADLVVGYVNAEHRLPRSGIDVFYAGGEGGWTRRSLIAEETNGGVPAMALGNLDGDDATDLVAANGEGEVWVFLGDGEGFFEIETSPESPSPVKGCAGSGVRLIDLDGDGRHEVVASFAGERTGPAGLPIGSYPGCPGQGSIRAWKAVSLEPAPAGPP